MVEAVGDTAVLQEGLLTCLFRLVVVRLQELVLLRGAFKDRSPVESSYAYSDCVWFTYGTPSCPAASSELWEFATSAYRDIACCGSCGNFQC